MAATRQYTCMRCHKKWWYVPKCGENYFCRTCEDFICDSCIDGIELNCDVCGKDLERKCGPCDYYERHYNHKPFCKVCCKSLCEKCIAYCNDDDGITEVQWLCVKDTQHPRVSFQENGRFTVESRHRILS